MEFGRNRSSEPVQATGLEKSWTTSAPRLISRFSRSSGLVDQIFFQCADGKSANALMSVAASNNIFLTCENYRSSMSATTSSWVRTCSSVACAKMVRMVDATISPEPFSITAKTSRTMWTG